MLRVIARMNVGGPALQVTGLMQDLDAGRFDHRLLTGHVDAGEGDYLALRCPDLPVMRVPGLGRSPRAGDDLRALRSLMQHVHAFRPHIVHTHTAKAGVLGRIAARSLRVPAVVHTFHGHLLHGYFSPAVTRAVVQAERTLARASTRLVAVGEQVRDDLLEAGIGRPGQYAVVPPGIHLPPGPARDEARSRLGLPPSGPVVTLVARLTQVKRPDRFVQMAAQLAARHPEATFAVCGEGDLLEETMRAAAPLGDRVRFLGWRGDVETVYAATDVVVLASDNEGMPVSLIEAGMAGVAAVATDVGSVREVVLDGVTGLLAPAEAAGLAAQVDRLLTDDALRLRLAGEAARSSVARFGRARLVSDIEHLYEQIAAQKGWTP